MAEESSVVIVGGTSGLGLELAKSYGARDRSVVVVGRDAARAEAVAKELGETAGWATLDLSEPHGIAEGLATVGPVDRLVLAAIDRDENTVRDYDVDRAIKLVTLKLVGYTEVVHQLLPRLSGEGSILLFGGLAKERPYPGSTTITTINEAVVGMVRTMAVELAPIRVNAIHPGIVGDSPYWSARPPELLEAVRAKTPTGRMLRMEEIMDAATFLLENPSVNGINLFVDGGWVLP